jgi:serine protease Do
MSRKEGVLGIIALVGGLLIAASSAGDAFAEAGSESRRTVVVEAIEKVRQSVVSITSEKKAASTSRWPFSAEENQKPRVNGMGTGVIVDARGYILTNHHVVDKVEGILVQLWDGTTYPARVLQFDPVTDLAVLKVDPARSAHDRGRHLSPIEIGTSSDLMVGETVVTVGNAFGYENTVSVGIISSLHRDVTLSDDQVYRNLIQTDACINPGNSGGPLINVDGELIGINVAVRAGAQGIGFALPIDEVKRVAAEMLSTRRLSSTWHGLVASDQRRGAKRGVVLVEVQSGSPAEAAGFKPGDELIKVGDLSVANALDIERGLLDAQPGHPAHVTIRRGGTDTFLPLEVKPLPGIASTHSAASDDVVWRLLGLKTLPVANEYVSAVSPKLRGGLYVQAVLPGSPAALAAIEKGDILVGMNVGARHWETIRADNIVYVLRQPETAGAGTALLYVVRRNGIQPRRITLGNALQQSILNR